MARRDPPRLGAASRWCDAVMLHLRGWSYIGALPPRARSNGMDGPSSSHGWLPPWYGWSAPWVPPWSLPRAAVPVVCSLLVVVLGWQIARLPASPPGEETRLAQRFAFEQQPLNGAA